jgi:GGDEF domain-containing protein
VPSLSTLSAIAVFTPALAGCLLLLSWLQHRRVTALALWGSGFITASIATTLIIVHRGEIPNFWSIVVGNALLAAAYGILWCGARKFDDKNISIPLALLPVLLWIVACSIGPIYARPEARATVMAAIGIVYTLLAFFELWRGRGDDVWRWPIMVLLLAHAAAIPIHIPLAGALTHPDPSDVDLFTFSIFEGAFICISVAYLLGGLVKDQIATGYQRASLTDPLTGVTNRRGFFQRGERLLMRARFAREPMALIMFDLDQFKRINDRYGHHVGDEVLTAFCEVATTYLRPNDLFGRIGGEELRAYCRTRGWKTLFGSLIAPAPRSKLPLTMRDSTAFTRQSAWVWPPVTTPQLILLGSLRQPIRRSIVPKRPVATAWKGRPLQAKALRSDGRATYQFINDLPRKLDFERGPTFVAARKFPGEQNDRTQDS